MRLVFLAAPIPRFRLCRWWELKIDFDNAEPMSALFLGVLVGVCCRPTDLFPADLCLDGTVHTVQISLLRPMRGLELRLMLSSK